MVVVATVEGFPPDCQLQRPDTSTKGDIEALPHYAGQSVGLVSAVQPARQIVKGVFEQAAQNLHGMVVRLWSTKAVARDDIVESGGCEHSRGSA
jgi:hypothetical protein